MHRDGALSVRHQGRGGRVRLPAEYVAKSLELGYASTPARSQGMTVDTTHVLVDSTTTRESLYVAATRGRLGAMLFVGTERHIGIGPSAHQLRHRRHEMSSPRLWPA